MEIKLSHLCKVCGLDQGESSWDNDGQSPTYAICDCCGVEFGYEDSTDEGVLKYRTAWLKSGAQWWNKKAKPQIWRLEEQLAALG